MVIPLTKDHTGDANKVNNYPDSCNLEAIRFGAIWICDLSQMCDDLL